MKASAALALLISFVGIVVLTHLLYTTAFDNEILEEPKPALEYNSAEVTEQPEAVLNEKTGVLGYTVYGEADAIVGTLYDVYVDPQDGEIKWISVSVRDTAPPEGTEAELILVSASEIREFSQEGPIAINAAADDFFERPYQEKHEEKLDNMLSVRTLPDSPVKQLNGRTLGSVERVTFVDGVLAEVYFEATHGSFDPDPDTFAAPFAALNFDVTYDQITKTTEVILTERQAGALQAYLNN